MGKLAVVATSALNQWALDYHGNVERIVESIRRAKAAGATYLCGTEMSITGYGCGDHYHERDTEMHAWEALATIMQHPFSEDIMVDVGLPVLHKNVNYNCKLVFLNRRILFIRPKMILANDGIMGYKEERWFTAWSKPREIEDHLLPQVIQDIAGQRSAPFGDGVIATRDTTVGYEICEELWNPESCHLAQYLDGAEIISNGLGSLEEYGRPSIGYQMVRMATMKSGGCYLLANQKGCDGNQGYQAGDACIGLNGSIVAYSAMHSLEDVDVITATVDLDAIRRYKAGIRSRCHHAARSKSYPRIEVDFDLTKENWLLAGIPSCNPVEPVIPTKEEQILRVPACWLWDFMRRSGQNGLLLPLSGDVDSSATACIVFSMCHLVVEAVEKGNKTVLADVRRLVGKSDYIPQEPRELCGQLVHTLYTESTLSSSPESKEIACELSQQIGSQHMSKDIDYILAMTEKSLRKSTSNSTQQMTAADEKQREIALQNLGSRLALTAAYFFAESETALRRSGKDVIVLASSNADRNLSGSVTKYGKCCGDINLIGRFPEEDLVGFIHFAKDRLKLPALQKLTRDSSASEEATCTYLQAVDGCGPYSMFGRLWHICKNDYTAAEVAERAKRFYRNQSVHRLNTFGLPPVFYMPSVGPPDDVRPLLYPLSWSWQFQAIDKTVKVIENMESKK